MAPTTFIKDTGILTILLLGLLLPSVLVSGQATTTNTASTDPPTNISSLNQTSPGTTHPTLYTNNGGTVTTITQSPTSIPGDSTPGTTQSPTSRGTASSSTLSAASTSGGSSSSTTQSPTSTSKGTASTSTLSAASTSGGSTSSTTQSPTSTSKGTASSSTLSAPSTSGGSTSSTTQSLTSTSKGTASTSTLSAPSTSRGLTSSTTHSLTSTSKGGSASSNTTANGSNVTTMSNSTSHNMTHLYCPSFSCSSSECYSMYMSRNATLCPAGCCCQLLRSMDMWYNVSCSASCADSCVNTTQTNCSVNCCNSTGCLSRNFESMMITTTMASTTTTTTTAKTSPTTTSTTVDNGNKCYSGSCTGDSCYSAFKDKTLQTCSSSQPHCQLKKDSTNSIITWTAGCANCTGLATCSGTTQPPCVVECCKASKTSCLLLNGTLNSLTSTNRGPYFHSELIVSSFCLLAVTLLL